NPDWGKLLAVPPATLSGEEQAFLDGPVDELCRMLDEWRISWELRDLPPEVWDFLKRHKFFAMIIPHTYRGLPFSPHPPSALLPLPLLRLPPNPPPPLAHRSVPRHGAELARAGRALAPLRHQGAAGLLAAAPRRREGDSLLRADQPGGGLGRRLDDRFRRGVPRHLAGPRGARHPPQLAQALHHALPDRDRDRARVQALRSRPPPRRARGDRHHLGAGADEPARRRDRAPPPARADGVPERPDLGPRRVHSDRQRHR